MANTVYYEDLFLEFYDKFYQSHAFFDLDAKDASAIDSFYQTIYENKGLTQSQAGYVLRLLDKYQMQSKRAGFDYTAIVKTLAWKYPFRILDMSKSVTVGQTNDGVTVILMKMPWAVKEKFEKELSPRAGYSSGRWDHDKKHRELDLHSYNVVQLYEFCEKNQFSISESFIELINQVEEIWQQQDDILPYSYVNDDQVYLHTQEESALEYWNSQRANDVKKDIFLAKKMGFTLKAQSPLKSFSEKISSSPDRFFWMKSFDDFFKLYSEIEGNVAIVLDRNTKNIKRWIEDFVFSAEKFNVSKKLIKVCFRESNVDDKVFNQWVKDNELGGKVSEGKIFIFSHKPAKWLFKDNIDVNIIVINSFTPVNEPTMQTWTSSHSCVVYIGELKPTPPRNDKFVKL